MTKFSLAVHGGAGTILKSNLTPELEERYHAGLRSALQAGHDTLQAGGSAVDAVTAAVCVLEDEPLFNAGRGAVFTSDGKQEMDAAIMDGATRAAGAVGGIFGPRNPVRAARAVMEKTDHVMLIGPNALAVARGAGLPFGDADYFFTQSRWDALQSTLKMRETGREDTDPARRHGTVGAVACDGYGNIAAATSTGGMTAKSPGRIGDTPIIGAGTFADNATCAVSGTGHGEVFIRYTAAAEIAARMRHAGQSLAQAADHVVMQDLALHDGSGGLIAVDAQGNVTMPFNCEGMYRGKVTEAGDLETFIYR
ncbi:beta-aspartyl-peptidase (threonine type) [Pseudorhodobacter antarcticus]|jgi:beta-aspartyl-peptidase (threonine type)|uniref:Isoaspartyl peptidase n=1 Tax=Pseudorhodobacter antarcticus TaxID=1077947 RepID=A0A1H8GHP0_9RHOB|nr:isoaspartyl peptidase/L-asparaginase [Pseudorhodobacter antarcticus]SEN43310.1 beta-aspartyl-peptidase (threonine type) [Pseudorhodobacter antarcticus]